MYDDDLQRITFSSTSFNNSVDVTVGGDRDLNLEEILKSFNVQNIFSFSIGISRKRMDVWSDVWFR